MKRFFILSALVLTLVAAAPASAHYLWLDPGEQIEAAPGDTVSVDVYLHFDADDSLQMWGLSLGFDDTAVGGAELTYGSIDYAPTDLGPGFSTLTYELGTSTEHAGESRIIGISKTWGPYTGWLKETHTAGTDLLLFTANFTFDGGVWDGEDVWIEFISGPDGFGFDSGFSDTLDVFYLDGDGPDYAAVPIPAAVWLLGSGLLGLAGIRRRQS